MTKEKINSRQLWATNRFNMESDNIKTKRYGGKSHHHWYLFTFILKFVKFFLKKTGVYSLGVKNANNIVFKEIPLYFPNLPEAFDGFTILQLSDLHIGNHPELEHKITDLIGDRKVDLCVLTGDYQTELHGAFSHFVDRMKHLTENIKSVNGFIGILGNHDSCHMVIPLEDIGINMLINENQWIEKDGEKIQIIGTDDVHYYYTDQSLVALEEADKGFSVALIHSPELYDTAADLEVDLYLCGHTHGGQICLPGGYAPIKHLNHGKEYYKGTWKYKEMQGVTSCGVGTSGIPVRFNTRGEVLLLKLKRK